MHITSTPYQNSHSQSVAIKNESESLTMRQPSEVQNATIELSDKDKELLKLDPKVRMMAMMIEAMTGKKVDITSFKSSTYSQPQQNETSNSPIFDYHYHRDELNAMSFSASGSVKLDDGSTREYSLSIEWAKSFVVDNRFSIQDGKIFTDPLVISFGGGEPLSQNSFAFNLNSDMQKLNYTTGGGYLAFDKNSDGKINDGSELFGPSTGKGFLELSAHDSDKNGWIDSNDAIFSQLRVWVVHEDSEQLYTLQEAGIGAISLSATDISYNAKSSIDNTFAHYKKASVALGDGAFGVFEVDLSV